MSDKLALCIPEVFMNDLPHKGFVAIDKHRSAHAFLREIKLGKIAWGYVPRSLCENDPIWKQVIPYVVFVNKKGVWCYVRTDKGDEQRLHSKRSVGIGGHIEPGDEGATLWDRILTGMKREIAEEVTITGDYKIYMGGFVCDDSDEVGSVHLGVVFVVHFSGKLELLDPANSNLECLEDEVDQDDFDDDFNLEPWSELILKHFDWIISPKSKPRLINRARDKKASKSISDDIEQVRNAATPLIEAGDPLSYRQERRGDGRRHGRTRR